MTDMYSSDRWTREADMMELPECRPDSLLGYLKAIGLMAVTGERGYWREDKFFLGVNNQAELAARFLAGYQIKPIANPWNKASGFLKDGGVDKYLKAKAPRWQQVKEVFQQIHDLLATQDLSKSSNELKPLLCPLLKESITNEHFQDWFASVLLVREVKGKFKAELNPLLGTGGNVSSIDLGAAYLSCCETIWGLETGESSEEGRVFALASIAGTPLEKSLVRSGILCHLSPINDFFAELQNVGSEDYPGNGTSSQMANPVDFILAIEGLLNFSGSLSQLNFRDREGTEIASYPLLVEVNTGTADTSDKTEMKKHEVWLPLWEAPITCKDYRIDVLSDLQFRLAEQVVDTIDFLQLLADKSEEFYFHRYSRFGFWKRKGQGNYAIHIGIATPSKNDLGSELRKWRKSVEPHPKQSNAIYQLFHSLEKSLADLARGVASIQELIILLGKVEVALSRQSSVFLPPQPTLSEEWVRQAYAEAPTPEFRLAASLASTGLRRYISTSRRSDKGWFWSRNVKPIRSQSLAVLASELMHQWEIESDFHPSKSARVNVSPEDISLFLQGVLDENRILELAIGLSLCKIPFGLWEYSEAHTPEVYNLAAKLQWNRDLTLPQPAIHSLRQGSTAVLQVQARRQQVRRTVPPTTGNGQNLATSLVFPVRG